MPSDDWLMILLVVSWDKEHMIDPTHELTGEYHVRVDIWIDWCGRVDKERAYSWCEISR